jgi:hypothetical protein
MSKILSNNQFDIWETINGDSVVGFTSAKEMKNLKWLDSAKVATYLMGEDGSHRKHLGMINLFQTTHNVSVPFMRDLFSKAAVLELAEGQSLTYDLPVSRKESRCYTAEDTSNLQDYPGIDGAVFEIVLSHEFTKGDILTYDPYYGEQVMVSEEHDVLQEGENFRHYVIMMTNDKTKWFPKEKLKAGLSYFKIGHALAEYGTTYSGINMDMNPAGTLTNEFLLGSPRGVETFLTDAAARRHAPGLNAFTEQMRSKVENQLDALGGKNMFFVAKKKGAGIDTSTMKIGTALEYLALMELSKMEAHSLLFAKAAVIQTSNGIKRVNEGVWHQLRRGKLIKYSRPGAITLDHIHEAVSYIYKNSTIAPTERWIKFKCGWFAYQNVMQLFREEAIQQLNGLPAGLLGNDGQLGKKVFSGDLDNLHMNEVRITSVMVPGIGKIIVEHDDSLDYQPMSDRFSAGFFGEGFAHTSYSMVIWDATDPQYSNVTSRVKNATLVEGGNQRSNIYYIKPEGAHVTYGYTQGRAATFDGNNENVYAAMKQMGREFWAHSRSAALVLDTTRFVVIELQDKTQSR